MENNMFVKYEALGYTDEEVEKKAKEWKSFMEKRRSVRFFSEKPVPQCVIEDLIMTASSAPSGAHKQPWVFCAVQSQQIKEKIRLAAEEEEFTNYNGRMGEEWLEDLKKFETNHIKEFLTVAPWLIIMFKKSYDVEQGIRKKNYYVSESVGIAAGILITAIHHAGLVTLTHTPSPMNFLQEILQRPENEKPFLLLPVGYPSETATVPDLKRKTAEEVICYYS